MPITIMNATLQDVSLIKEFQMKMALETEGLELEAATVEKGITAVIEDPHKGNYFIAYLDHKAVGCLLLQNEWSDWRNGTVKWIHSVYVDPSYRSKGIFKALFHHVKSIVKETPEWRGLRLYVDKSNLKAQHVYKSLGMTNEHYDLFEWMK